MKYHVVSGTLLSEDITAPQNATTLQGQTLSIVKGTVFGGTEYPNARFTVNGANVLAPANFGITSLASNGAVHIIDALLLPTGVDLPPPNVYGLIYSLTAEQLPPPKGRYIESTFQTALKAADLVPSDGVPRQSGKGFLHEIDSVLTVFAPTNAAFEALEPGVLSSLLRAENKGKLVDMLKYHILSTKVFSTDLVASQTPTTMQGQTVSVLKNGSIVTVNGATVSVADNLASNGVVHIIDAVLMPPGAGTSTGAGSTAGVNGSSSSSMAGVVALALACLLLIV